LVLHTLRLQSKLLHRNAILLEPCRLLLVKRHPKLRRLVGNALSLKAKLRLLNTKATKPKLLLQRLLDVKLPTLLGLLASRQCLNPTDLSCQFAKARAQLLLELVRRLCSLPRLKRLLAHRLELLLPELRGAELVLERRGLRHAVRLELR
jgi:hypothetical protein